MVRLLDFLRGKYGTCCHVVTSVPVHEVNSIFLTLYKSVTKSWFKK